MEKTAYKTYGIGEVQIFEVTMDNSEDQDELNRRLRKPGEHPLCSPPKIDGPGVSSPSEVQGESARNH